MSILANDPLSLNARSHRRSRSRSSSQTARNPGPSSFPKAPFFPPFSEQSARARVIVTSTGVEDASAKQKTSSSMAGRHRKTPSQSLNGNGHAYTNGNGAALQNGHSQKSDAHAYDDDDKLKKAAAKAEKIDLEIPRKVLHSSIGFLVIYLYTSHTSAQKVALVLSANCAVITSVDFVRLRNPRFARFYERTLGFLMRDSEKTKTNGVIWYLLGCIFVLALYPQDIAVVSILILSWCDTTASFFGRLWGRYTPRLPRSIIIPGTSLRLPTRFAPRKSVAGFLAGAVTGTLIAVGFWGWLTQYGEKPPSLPEPLAIDHSISLFESRTNGMRLAIVAVVTGLIAAFAEAADIGSLDDNLTLPIISGGVLWALFRCIDYLFSS